MVQNKTANQESKERIRGNNPQNPRRIPGPRREGDLHPRTQDVGAGEDVGSQKRKNRAPPPGRHPTEAQGAATTPKADAEVAADGATGAEEETEEGISLGAITK